MKLKKFVVQNIDDSISLFEKNTLIKNYKPQYDLKKSYEHFENILKNSFSKIDLLHIKHVSWSSLSLCLQPIFWHVSLNIIKYKEFFDEYGFMIPSQNFKSKELLVRNSYNRAVLFYKNDSFLRKFIINLRFIKSHLFFIFWILINFITIKRNKIWIDKFIITNYRYNNPELKKIIHDSKYLEILNMFSSPTSFSLKKKGFYDGIEKEILKRISGYRLWSIAIKLLKPKRIITRDDLGQSQGVLLAAKINKIEIIGVMHGSMTQFQSYMFGPTTFCILYPIVFDKLYLLHSSFVDYFRKKNTLYNDSQIKLSGWLQKFQYDKQRTEYNNNLYVLYPFEHHTDYILIKELLLKFIKLGKKIIIKKYPGWKNYKMFENMDFELVDDFEKKHLSNTLAVVSLASTMTFEFLSRNYLVIYPHKSGYFLYDELNVPGLISDKEFFSRIKDFCFDFKLDEITKEFKSEFL